MYRSVRLFLGLLCVASLFAAGSAQALSVAATSSALGAGNSADASASTAANVSQVDVTAAGGATADVIGATETAGVRYSANAWADQVAFSGGNAVNLTHSYDVTFTINADAGTLYAVAIDSVFSGLIQAIDDDYWGEASAKVENFAASMSVNGGVATSMGSLVPGSDYLVALGYYGGSDAIGHTGADGLTDLSGLTTLAFNVSFDSQLYSDTDEVGFLFGQDEAGAESGVEAGEYAGTGRTIGDDGSFLGVTATVTSVNPIPEPGSFALLSIGLLGLAAYSRRTS